MTIVKYVKKDGTITTYTYNKRDPSEPVHRKIPDSELLMARYLKQKEYNARHRAKVAAKLEELGEKSPKTNLPMQKPGSGRTRKFLKISIEEYQRLKDAGIEVNLS